MFEKKAVSYTKLNSGIAKRWSGRAFDPTRHVNKDDLHTVLEAARWAPSCYNCQPWRFIVANKVQSPEVWEKVCNCIVEGNIEWAERAPVLIVALADKKFPQNDGSNHWAEYDTGAAVMNLSIQAADLNLMIHQMAGFDESLCRQLFSLPENLKPMVVIAMGYQAPKESIPGMLDEELAKREFSARTRKELQELLYVY